MVWGGTAEDGKPFYTGSLCTRCKERGGMLCILPSTGLVGSLIPTEWCNSTNTAGKNLRDKRLAWPLYKHWTVSVSPHPLNTDKFTRQANF